MPKNQDSAVIVFKENDKTRDRKRCLRPWFIWPVALAWLALGLSGCSVSPTDLHASDAVDPVIMSRPHRFAQSRIRPEHELPATIFYVGAHPDDIEFSNPRRKRFLSLRQLVMQAMAQVMVNLTAPIG